MLPFCPRDLKVSNLLMTDKGCVKTGGCWVPAGVSVSATWGGGAGQCSPALQGLGAGTHGAAP